MTATVATATTWKIDPVHTAAEFKVKHMMITNVTGQFTAVNGSVWIDEDDVTQPYVESNDRRGFHQHPPRRSRCASKEHGFLRCRTISHAEVCFDTRHPPGSGQAGSGRRPDDPRRDSQGDVRGGRADKAEHRSMGKYSCGLSATTKINRKDFGLTWNSTLETGGVLVGDQVTISLDVQAIKA